MAEVAQATKQTELSDLTPPPVDAVLPRVRTLAEITAERQAVKAEAARSYEKALRATAKGSPLPPSVQVRPSTPRTAQEVQGNIYLSQGALRLWTFLHALALVVLRQQGYTSVPDSITFHLPAVMLAGVVRYSERHLYRLADELCAAGLLDERGHVTQVGKLRRYDGTLWAVKLRPGAASPRLRYWDFRHDWRPDFAEDYYGEQGAFRAVQDAMSEPLTCEGKTEAAYSLAKTWAAATRTRKNPAEGGSDMPQGETLQAVAYALPALLHLHPRQRHREVSRLATELAHVLGEKGRVPQWCRDIYAAIQSENEERQGLQYMALQLMRLATDLAEGAPWKRPGAVLAARLNA
jgi:hypothetical protein